jgi:hypothetical protein
MNAKRQQNENLKGQTDSSATNPQRRVQRTDTSLNAAGANASFEEQRASARLIGETQLRLTALRKTCFRNISGAVENERQEWLNAMFYQADDLLREARGVLVQRNVVRTNRLRRSTGEVLDVIENDLQQRWFSQQEVQWEGNTREHSLTSQLRWELTRRKSETLD